MKKQYAVTICGSTNTHNAVGNTYLVEAKSENEAKEIFPIEIYNGQFLDVILASKLSAEDYQIAFENSCIG